ncbi:MAG TPA: alkaline phosphatase [Parvularcula sp.]|nr:alkaline phosphatase [Parvularcula sp.]HBS30741.1 alkaline phosphatase [Parvularcula sp.]HBS36598.1 alkaline phosphatase [Parvularcula sp.]
MTRLTRRAAIGVLGASAAACARTPVRSAFDAAGEKATGVFAHGVASGDPAHDSVVLWSRLTPAAQGPVAVRWEVAETEAFTRLSASGEVTAAPERDFTLKAVAAGLKPGRRYFYRFRAGDAVSPIGRTRTVPDGRLDQARFAVLSCSNYPFGYFNVYDRVAREEGIDAVIHLGDYIYEYGTDGYGGETGKALGRDHEPPTEILTLADYRRRHAQYKADPSTQAMHAAHALIAIWDDHETANNSWKGGSDNHDPSTEGSWEDRKRAALQAYFEWMPVREPAPGAAREALFRAWSWGDLLTLVGLETRLMARSAQIEYNDITPTLTDAEAVRKFRDETLWGADREMLGEAQLNHVAKAMRRSAERGEPWRLIANQIIMAKVTAPNLAPHVTEQDILDLEKEWDQARAFIQFSALGLPTNLDAWDGYPAARERLYDALRKANAEGVIVVTGDTHTWWANNLVARDGVHIGVELGVNSVTSPSPYRKSFLGGKGAEYALLTNQENKDVRYISGEDHGFIDLTLTREEAKARFIAVDTIEAPSYNAFEKAAFTIAKSNGAAQFVDVDGLSLEERALF